MNSFEDLESYFTDVEHICGIFKTLVAEPKLPKRLLIIHGVGGIGKSSLLRIFYLHCKNVRVAVALASGDEIKSAVDILSTWADILQVDGVPLPSFMKTLKQYRAIQVKVDEQARKIRDLQDKMTQSLSKAAARTIAETAGSAIPVVGPLISALGGMGTEALMDWLRGFLVKSEIDLLLDPVHTLTDNFLTDLAQAAIKQRLVIMIDTFEQITALDNWSRELAQQLHHNVLLVIAGRAAPNWDRPWPGWLAHAEVHELTPMADEIVRSLVYRYYAAIRRGSPDPVQVEAIIRFARGLPIVVTSAVQLWIQYGVEDFQAVKPQVVADLVDRLLEGVPQEMIPVLEAAAVLRWFNKETLRAVTGQTNVNTAYDALRRFPFMRPRTEGLALHDTVREILDENLRMHDPERHYELHERAAVYFEKLLSKVTGKDAERAGLERLYHRIHTDEETGMRQFQEIAERLTRYQLVNQLRALLNDANMYPLEQQPSRLWREYYNARLAHLEARFSEAEKIYRSIGENDRAEPKLQAYALCDLGVILRVMRQQADSIPLLERSLSLVPVDSKLALSFTELSGAFRREGELRKSVSSSIRAIDFYTASEDVQGLVYALNRLKYYYLNQGEFKQAISAKKQAEERLASLPSESLFLKMELLGGLAIGWAWAGRLKSTEQELREALSIAMSLGLINEIYYNRDLGYVLGMSGEYEGAENHFNRSIKRTRQIKEAISEAEEAVVSGLRGAILVKTGSLKEAAQELHRSLASKQKHQDLPGLPEIYVLLGELSEINALRNLNESIMPVLAVAESYYNQCLDMRWIGRHYFESAALTGLVRVKHSQNDYKVMPALLSEAEQLAQQYEYNNHLASLRLTQGHIVWDGHLSAVSDVFDDALRYYQHALVYALRYNRFLLDEVLGGGEVSSPLRPIIPQCLEHGAEGRRMLLALRDWWQTGLNDTGTPRSETVSAIPQGISLLEAERVARKREPGNRSPQVTVLDQVNTTLGG